MKSKPTKAKGPEQSGPLTVENKQRLPRLSAREKAAAVTGGAVDRSIPEDSIRKRLRDEGGIAFDVEAILAGVGLRASYIRGFVNPRDQSPVVPVSLEPAEIVKQAAVTCADIAELIERLRHLHPDLECWADDVLYRAHGHYFHVLRDRMEHDLWLMRAAVDHAGRTVAAYPKKTNSTGNEWTRGRNAIAASLRQHSVPRMEAKSAKALAVELLAQCGLKSPRKPGEQR